MDLGWVDELTTIIRSSAFVVVDTLKVSFLAKDCPDIGIDIFNVLLRFITDLIWTFAITFLPKFTLPKWNCGF